MRYRNRARPALAPTRLAKASIKYGAVLATALLCACTTSSSWKASSAASAARAAKAKPADAPYEREEVNYATPSDGDAAGAGTSDSTVRRADAGASDGASAQAASPGTTYGDEGGMQSDPPQHTPDGSTQDGAAGASSGFEDHAAQDDAAFDSGAGGSEAAGEDAQNDALAGAADGAGDQAGAGGEQSAGASSDAGATGGAGDATDTIGASDPSAGGAGADDAGAGAGDAGAGADDYGAASTQAGRETSSATDAAAQDGATGESVSGADAIAAAGDDSAAVRGAAAEADGSLDAAAVTAAGAGDSASGASAAGATGEPGSASAGGEADAARAEEPLIVGVVEAPGKKATRNEEVIPLTLGGLLPMTLGVDGQGEFDFDQAVLREQVKELLDVLVSRLKEAEYDRIEIVGHTDRIGTEDYNQYLSERRAWAVARYLVKQGVPVSKMRVEGRGMHEPVSQADACDTADIGRDQLIACLQKDRRVVISASIRKVDVEVQ